MSEFGDTFRSARESRGLSIEAVALETRISARFLRAIEEEAFDELPGGVFDRGFIRAYASQVGLDADAMLEAYTTLSGEANPAESARTRSQLAPDSARDRHVLPIAVGGLVVLAFLFAITSRNDVPPEPASPRLDATSASSPAPLERAVVVSTPATLQAEAGGSGGLDDVPDSEDAFDDEQIAEAEPDQMPDLESDEEAADSSPPPAPATDAELAQADLNGAADGDEDEEAVEEEDALASFEVRVEVRETTQLYVALDGDVMYQYVTINPPFWRTYTVSETLELRVANPSAVSLNIDGAPVPTLGPPDQAWSGTITRDNAALLTEGRAAPDTQ